MDDDDEDIFCNNINDRYAARPHKLDNMSLAEFAATFTLCRNTADDAADLDHQPEVVEESAPETHKQERITLMNGLGVMNVQAQQSGNFQIPQGERRWRSKI